MKISKKGVVFIFLILGAMLLGSMIAVMCKDSTAFQFLSYAKAIGFEDTTPMVLDLVIIRITFGLTVNISVAHVVTFILAIFAYPKIAKNVE